MLLLIYLILCKSYSNADLKITEVSKGKHLYYQAKGIYHSLKIQEHFQSLNVDSNVVIDLGFTHFVTTFEIQAERFNENMVINVTLKGHSPHNDEEKKCPEIKKFAKSITYKCWSPTRFLIVEINQDLVVENININGQDMHSERFAGCYEFVDIRKGVSVQGITDCIYRCQQQDIYYAAFMDMNCHCLEELTDMITSDYDYCTGICEGDDDFCGLESNVLLYFTTNFTKDFVHPKNECMKDQSHCLECRKAGWTGIDCNIRDCSGNNGGCGKYGCSNTHDMYMIATYCECRNGYKPLFTGSCEDIDECSLKNNSCYLQSSGCENTLGSYKCNCSHGLIQINAITCKDIDECLNESLCGNENIECINTWASYTCKCKLGYDGLTSDGCHDVDECSIGLCKNGICENTVGSFFCNCSQGFLFKDGNCEDIDECSTGHLCDLNSTGCVNEEGTFHCVCKTGFKMMTEHHCKDVDECSQGNHACDKSATCSNTIGSYLCNCPAGMTPKSYTYIIICEDIDECESSTCDHRISFCLNHMGGYMCQCRNGLKNINDFTCITEKENDTVSDKGKMDPDLFGTIDFVMFNTYLKYTILAILAILIVTILVNLRGNIREDVNTTSDDTLSIDSTVAI